MDFAAQHFAGQTFSLFGRRSTINTNLHCRRPVCALASGIAILGSLFWAFPTAAQTVAPEVAAVSASDPWAIGQTIASPKTFQHDLSGLINKVAGQPSQKACRKYNRNLEAYLQAAEKSRTGKAFEAVLAHQENQRLAATGSKQRMLVTAAEQLPHHSADILMIDDAGCVIEHYQSKTGWQNLQKSLSDPRYATMKIVTDDESLAILTKKLAQEESKAANRGLELAEEWKVVKRAIGDGRLLQRTPSGAPLPTLDYVRQQSRAALESVWKKLALTAENAAPPVKAVNAKSVGNAAQASDGTARLAQAAPDDVARAAAPVIDDVARASDDVARAAAEGSTAARTVAKVALPVAVVVDAGFRVRDGVETEKRFAAGEITSQQREVAHARNAAGMAGGWAGAWAGAELGAAGGAAAGTAVAPGPGTAIGGVVGGVAGGVAGYFGGEAAAAAAADWAVEKVHAAGTTVSETANSAAGSVQRAWNWAWGN